jgi:hypothetical protein
MRKDCEGWQLAGMLLLVSALFCVGSCRKAPSTQLDLSVFQKEGVGKEQESKDRFECHTRAVQRTGFDPAMHPPDDTSPMRAEEKRVLEAEQFVERRKQQQLYDDALKRCMTERGYTIIDH